MSAAPNRLELEVIVAARASRSESGNVEAGRLRIRTTAAPVDGAANRDVTRQLASVFGVPKSRIALLRGAASRSKRFAITEPKRRPAWLEELS